MKGNRTNHQVQRPGAFTLVELMVAMALFLVVMVVLLQVTGAVADIWKSSTGKVTAFESARSAFATITRTLSRATLNTYNDYVDAAGQPRTAANTATFVPHKFARASELHFLAGPAVEIIPDASAGLNPGHAVLFQAPLAETEIAELNIFDGTVNSVGFYIQYAPTDSERLPTWLQPLFGSTHRFRLVQIVEATEALGVYKSTQNLAPDNGYDVNWVAPFGASPTSTTLRTRVLAEDVCLLVMRPRLSPEDEQIAATQLGTTASPDEIGAILSPNYHYDSRAWEQAYPPGQRVLATSPGAARVGLMRNQLPPIMDVAMVCVDRRSLARYDSKTATPPAVLNVPSNLFTQAAALETDLATYSLQLSDAGIRHKVFRTSVDLQGAKWSSTQN